jgi:neutral ceramidase
VQTCHGRGPTWGKDELLAQSPTGGWDWSGNQVTAKYQADAALDILGRADGDLIPIEGEVRSVKWNVAMGAGFQFALDNGTVVTTCPAALGYGFAGGTTDGPGAFDFSQGTNDTDSHNPFWDVVRTAIKAPSAHQIDCQSPKRVLLSIGEQHYPYDWGPGGPDGIVETQILRAGNLFLLVVPGEFTTMAGRRIKERAAKKIAELGLLPKGQAPIVVLSGPANTYSHCECRVAPAHAAS